MEIHSSTAQVRRENRHDPIKSQSFRNLVSLNSTWNIEQVYTLPPVTRMTGIAKLVRLARDRWDVRFLPAWIGDDSAPLLLDSSDSRFAEVAALIAQSSQNAGMNTKVCAEGNELLLRPGP